MLDGDRGDLDGMLVGTAGRDRDGYRPRPPRRAPGVRRLMADNGSRTIDLQAVIKAYRRYAGIYDMVFGPAFQMGRARSVARINGLDCRHVLEVGVGTGLSLPRYRADKRIVGIDVSREMLTIARDRVRSHGLGNVDALAEMDAQNLGFAAGRFDAVVAMHVMSVVPDPHACLAEMQRVCKPGGTILICNHFAGKGDQWISRRMQPLAKWLGWHPDFGLARMLENSSLRIASTRAVPPFGMFKLVELSNV